LRWIGTAKIMETTKTDIELVKEIKEITVKLGNLSDAISSRTSELDEEEFVLAHPPGTTLTHPEETEYFALIEQMEKILQTFKTLSDYDREFYHRQIDMWKMIWGHRCSANVCRRSIVMKDVEKGLSEFDYIKINGKLIQILLDNGEEEMGMYPKNMKQDEYQMMIDALSVIERKLYG
jgi:hypothetical protein